MVKGQGWLERVSKGCPSAGGVLVVRRDSRWLRSTHPAPERVVWAAAAAGRLEAAGAAGATEGVWRGSGNSGREAGGGEILGIGEGMEAAAAGGLAGWWQWRGRRDWSLLKAAGAATGRLVVERQGWLERVSKGRQQKE